MPIFHLATTFHISFPHQCIMHPELSQIAVDTMSIFVHRLARVLRLLATTIYATVKSWLMLLHSYATTEYAKVEDQRRCVPRTRGPRTVTVSQCQPHQKLTMTVRAGSNPSTAAGHEESWRSRPSQMQKPIPDGDPQT